MANQRKHRETGQAPDARFHISTPNQYYCVSGKVNSADKLYLVIESVKPDAKYPRPSTIPVPADGAGGNSIR
jgi:hypothetical protein